MGDEAQRTDAVGIVFIQGAEARVDATTWMGRDTIAKKRIPKAYRHAELDARLRAERTRDEAHLLIQARRAGVAVPVVHDIDRAQATITMERIVGPSLREVLGADPADVAKRRLRALGVAVGRLHDAGLTHGDLTTSNVIVPDPASDHVVLIDFGLGQFSQEDEARGVDLHLVEEALDATDQRAEPLMQAFLEGYGGAACAARAMQRLEDIRLRGRYREAV